MVAPPVFYNRRLLPPTSQRIARARAQLPFHYAPFTPADLPFLPEAITEEGHVQTLPSFWSERGGMDGFFIARLRRV